MLSNRVRSFINRYNLLSLEQVHLVALSGGADSVALLLLLKELGYRIEAIHCNFHLRGAESDADEQFCVTLCKQEGIPLHRVHFDTKCYAETHGVSIEMAARELRYAYFETLRNDMKAAEICVAHHREDSIETVLLNMIRGTGIDGLTGIAPRRGHIVRPLLEESKKALLAYLESRNQRYVTDSSNLVADVKRNKVRLQLLPLLEEMNPSVTESVHRMSQHLAEVMKMADSAIPAACSLVQRHEGGEKMWHLSYEQLHTVASPQYVLWRCFQPFGFSSTQIGEMARWLESMQTSFLSCHKHKAKQTKSGKQWVADKYVVITDRDAFIMAQRQTLPSLVCTIPEPGIYPVKSAECKFHVSLTMIDSDFSFDSNPHRAFLDASSVRFPLKVRTLQAGDRFVPLGMTGSKLVSDFLTDRKKNLLAKQRQLVVEDAQGHIIWVVGERICHPCRITASTCQCLLLAVD